MKTKKRRSVNKITLIIELILTLAICFGLAYSSIDSLRDESTSYASEVMASYDTLTENYVRAFKILKMESILEIEKDLSADEMQKWALSRDEAFNDAIGDGVFDGFAFTYKGKYIHSWNYGDYSAYVSASRPWYQTADAAGGEIAVVAPYTTYLAGTDLIERYDTLRMSIVQKYTDDIYYDFDLDVEELNALVSDRHTIYSDTVAFLIDNNGYVLSSSDPEYYGHNINTVDAQVTDSLSDALLHNSNKNNHFVLKRIDGKLRMMFSSFNKDGMTLYTLISFAQVFQKNLLFVILLAIVLMGIEIFFYMSIEKQLKVVKETQESLRDALGQAESNSRAKGEFMSRMSHEIRTPINAVIGYLDIAHSELGDTEKVTHCLEKSQEASKHLLSIINNVLDISSIESGRMKIAHDSFDLKQMITSLTTMFYAQAKTKDIRFEVTVDPMSQDILVGDELRLKQILLNLLSNAVKFTPKNGSIYLKIRQSEADQDKIHMQFKVQDSGIGMSKEYMSRMFKPFEQESAETARDFGGTGLGLSICNNLVNMMGGQLDVDSVQGHGTTFTVSLAFDRASQEEMQQHLGTESFTHLKALIVDDETDTSEYIQKVMERCGVQSDTANSGKKALRRIKSRDESGQPYDLCIVDWNMPEMNGIELAREIRSLKGGDIPIIIATAYDFTAIEDEARKAGVNKLIAKPVFQSTMMDLLVSTFGKYDPAGSESSEVSEEPASELGSSMKAAENSYEQFNGMRLILAEDNEMNMEIALDILGKAGLDIMPVADGQAAVDTFTRSAPGTYKAILMDIQMPVMDGYEATRVIRASDHPDAKTIPIIAMTANAFTEDVTAALASGMNDHISKPVSYDRLFSVLARLTAKNK